MKMKLNWTQSLLLAITAAFAAVDCAYAQQLGVTAPARWNGSLKQPFIGKGPSLNLDQKKLNLEQNKLNSDTKIVLPKNPSWSKADGGVDTGGGTLVKFSKGMGLLDLYVHSLLDFYDVAPSVKLLETPAFIKYGIDLLDHQSVIFHKTLIQLTRWEKSSPLLITNLKKALLQLPIFYFDGSFEFIDGSYILPNGLNIPKESLRLGALYVKNFGVLISKYDFENLSEKNQIALLIHEGLRHQQISFGQNGLEHSLIQELTAKLIQKPTGTLDSERYLTGAQYRVFQAKPQVLSEIQKTAQSLCPNFPETCSFVKLEADVDLKHLSEQLYQIIQRTGKVWLNTMDPQVGMRYQRAHSALLDAWQSLITLKMDMEDQGYREALFEFGGANGLKVYLRKCNANEPIDLQYADYFFKILQQFRDSGLIEQR